MRRAPALLAAAALASGSAAAAPAAVEDTMAQRLLACTACHGREGRAAPDGYYPRIAGKPAGYLYNQLLNFRDGRRHYALMAELLQPLSDDYLREIAVHFASLDLPYPAPAAATATAEQLARAETLVRSGDPARQVPACAACHGASLTGVAPAVPGLIGLPRDYLNAQLGAWLAGQRHAQSPDCMADIARRLAPGDVAALTSWLSSRPVADDAHPAPALTQALPLPCGGVPKAMP